MQYLFGLPELGDKTFCTQRWKSMKIVLFFLFFSTFLGLLSTFFAPFFGGF
jgi:hypothetical protein